MQSLVEAAPEATRILGEALRGELEIKNENLVNLAGDILDRVGFPKAKYQTVEHTGSALTPEAAQFIVAGLAQLGTMFGVDTSKGEFESTNDKVVSSYPTVTHSVCRPEDRIPTEITSTKPEKLHIAAPKNVTIDPDLLDKLTKE